MISSTPAAAASRIESAAKRGGTKIIAVFGGAALRGLPPAVEDGNAVDVLAALAGRDAADDVRAVCAVVERVEGSLAAGDARDRQAGVLVDQDGHQPAPALRERDNLLGGLVHRARGVHARQAGLLEQLPARHVVGAVEAHDERDAR